MRSARFLFATMAVFVQAAAFGSAVQAAEKEIVLAEGGRAKAAIVVANPADPGLKRSAELFAELVEKISGAKPTIVAADAPAATARPVVAIGQSPLTEKLGVKLDGLGPSGVVIASGPDWLVLMGPDKPEELSKEISEKLPLARTIPSGTMMTVLTFLEKYWDVDWLFPGDLGLVHPKRDRLTVPAGENYRYTPPIVNRYMRNVMFNQRAESGAKQMEIDVEKFKAYVNTCRNWFDYQRLASALKINAGHSFGKYWERFGATHPDWFALQPDGSRDQSKSPDRSRLCLSNPELRAQVAEDAKEYFATHPDERTFSIALNDGGRTVFCTCPKCTAWDAPEAGTVQWGSHVVPKMSDRVWRFSCDVARAVEKTCPGRFLTAYAYSAYCDPPTRKLDFPPNLIIAIVGGEDTIKAWQGIGGMKTWRPNAFSKYGLGADDTASLGRDVQAAWKAGVVVTDLDGNLGHWLGEGINYYVVAKMLWDPSVSASVYRERYLRLGFGPAAKSVQAFYDRTIELEKAIAAAPADQKPARGGPGLSNFAKFYTKAWFDGCEKVLRQAQDEAKADPGAAARVKKMLALLDLDRIRIEYFTAKGAVEEGQALLAEKKITQEDMAARNQRLAAAAARRKAAYQENAETGIVNTPYLAFYGI